MNLKSKDKQTQSLFPSSTLEEHSPLTRKLPIVPSPFKPKKPRRKRKSKRLISLTDLRKHPKYRWNCYHRVGCTCCEGCYYCSGSYDKFFATLHGFTVR